MSAMKAWTWLPATGLVVALATPAGLLGGEKKSEVYNFAALKSAAPDAARAQAEAWLKAAGKTDAATQKQFQSIWEGDRPVLDRVTETLTLGNPQAATLLADAADAAKPAPKEVPALLKDKKLDSFFRANLAVAYAKALSGRRVFEEALDTLREVKPEEVADPSAYFFHKAVAEYSLIRRDAAAATILRLLDDVSDSPERYRMVGMLMFVNMQTWKKDERDLGFVSRLMDNSERRLDLSRGGEKTQEIQKKIVFRLDEMIKELENQCKNCSNCNGGNCPSGGKPKASNAKQSSSPQLDSVGGAATGPGNANEEVVRNLSSKWGALPEKERVKALAELTRDLPPRHREVVEEYFRALARTQTPGGR